MTNNITKTQLDNLKFIKKNSPNISEADILKRIKNIEWSLKLFPQVCEVTINYNCNNKCIFCYYDEKTLNKSPQPSLKSIYKTLYLARKNGANLANIVGGEPTLRKDLGKIANFARKIGYPCVKISTNGRLLSDKNLVRSLVEDGINMFNISIHSSNPEIHNKMVGIKTAFSDVMKACENIITAGAELGCDHVINKLNYKLFPKFIDLTYNKLGINYYNVIYIHYEGMGYANFKELSVLLDKTVKYIEEGVNIIKKSNFPAFSRILVNFPPCFFPSYISILADWEKEPRKKEFLLIDDKTVDLSHVKDKEIGYTKNCTKCLLYKKCKGFDKSYIENISDNFKPLKKIYPQRLKTIFDYEKN